MILNGLGRTKYEELFVVWKTVAALLAESGHTVVQPEVGELVTSLDMAGCSLTVMWLDDELERLWTSPADTPAYRKGRRRRPTRSRSPSRRSRAAAAVTLAVADDRSRPWASLVAEGICGIAGADDRGRGRAGTHRRRCRRRRSRPRHGQGHDAPLRRGDRLPARGAAAPRRC